MGTTIVLSATLLMVSINDAILIQDEMENLEIEDKYYVNDKNVIEGIKGIQRKSLNLGIK